MDSGFPCAFSILFLSFYWNYSNPKICVGLIFLIFGDLSFIKELNARKKSERPAKYLTTPVRIEDWEVNVTQVLFYREGLKPNLSHTPSRHDAHSHDFRVKMTIEGWTHIEKVRKSVNIQLLLIVSHPSRR